MILLIGKRRWQRLVDIEIKKKVLSEDFLSQPLLEVPQQLILLRCVAQTQ